jgi:ectoine hydroxylase-related dioxygenase (phytanoyl-CoA dioxygenase family)
MWSGLARHQKCSQGVETMKQQDIEKHAPTVIGAAQRQAYFDEGYICLANLISEEWLEKLRSALDRQIDISRSISQSDGTYDLEDGHSQESPRLRRISFVDDLDPVFWEFATTSVLPDLAADIMGPNISFREFMVNFKWSGGGQEVKWHQDIPFYPHTNLSPAQFLVFLGDVGPDQGPLQVIPGSHRGPVHDHYDNQGNWTGYISDDHHDQLNLDKARELTGTAGTVSVHHCVTVHGSRQNNSPQSRPALVIGYTAADAVPYTAAPYPSSHYGDVVRGTRTGRVHQEETEMRMPPDWSDGYTSIFEHQESNQT